MVKVMLNAESVDLHTGVTVMAVHGYVVTFVTDGIYHLVCTDVLPDEITVGTISAYQWRRNHGGSGAGTHLYFLGLACRK